MFEFSGSLLESAEPRGYDGSYALLTPSAACGQDTDGLHSPNRAAAIETPSHEQGSVRLGGILFTGE
ncbi:conserved hypothetical protein [Stutzerimonas stutzeri A1501]|uniref:Uncharacterized protein n=1 Tax=Stutzerimonas stutzeri (strain A1501) TaxID=379731 RepID=A4VMQ5_STUS1|nr:conserved hypothetical protein [Stutzerimonas stutzeri A1501]